MTDETRHALGVATAERDAIAQRVERQKVTCLARIADELPGRVDAAARQIALVQSKVTMNELGLEGLEAVRAKLAKAATEMAEHVRAAGADGVKWPRPASYYTNQKELPRAVDALLSSGVDGLRTILGEAGYRLAPGASTPGNGLSPWHLYDAAGFEKLANSMELLDAAQREVEKATKAHETATVAALWDKSGGVG